MTCLDQKSGLELPPKQTIMYTLHDHHSYLPRKADVYSLCFCDSFPHDNVVTHDGHHWPCGVGGAIVLAVKLVVVLGKALDHVIGSPYQKLKSKSL